MLYDARGSREIGYSTKDYIPIPVNEFRKTQYGSGNHGPGRLKIGQSETFSGKYGVEVWIVVPKGVTVYKYIRPHLLVSNDWRVRSSRYTQ